MNFGVMVDVCLGVLSVMILFSLAATAINEMIADNVLNMRGKSLYEAILGLARKYEKAGAGKSAEKIVEAFYENDAIAALMEKRSRVKLGFAKRYASVKGDFRPPSAIEPATFATAMRTVLGGDGATKVERAVGSIEDDFALTMDRVSGWYVRKVKTSLFVIGLVLAIGANVDLLRYAGQLAADANLAARIDATVGMIDALQVPQNAAPPADLAEVAKALQTSVNDLNGDLASAGMTVGWDCVERPGGDSPFCRSGQELNGLYPTQFVGWLIIAFGVTLGAQFWFDLFRSLVNLRTPGKTGGTVEQLSRSNDQRGETAPPTPAVPPAV